MNTPPLVFLMGPTATGKTDIAVELLQHFPMEIISVDSALVYKGMDIGTAKPSIELQKQAPHRLIDICDPAEIYSAARFRADALKEIEEIERQGKIPLLVGGTGLYFRALETGMTELPKADSSVRTRLEMELHKRGVGSLYERLKVIDPDSARRIDANDPQRIQRALEVYELTGKTMTELFQEKGAKGIDKQIIKIILMPEDRDKHRQIVKIRFEQMLASGLLEEVQGLYERGDLNASMPAMRMVGYRQLWNYLEGKIQYDEAVNRAIVATRQLAKRQMTWFRKEQNANFFALQDHGNAADILNKLINDPLLSETM